MRVHPPVARFFFRKSCCVLYFVVTIPLLIVLLVWNVRYEWQRMAEKYDLMELDTTECGVVESTASPLVFFYTPLEWNIKHLWPRNLASFLIQQLLLHPECPTKCVLTSNIACARTADVHVFALASSVPGWIATLNSTALRGHLTFESPVNTPIWEGEPDFFDFSINYRSSSGVHHPYDQFFARTGRETEDQIWTPAQVQRALDGKRKKVLWIISDCNTHRQNSGSLQYVEVLSKHIEVTRLGGCFRKRVSQKEMKQLVDSHHFYLAFENSVCPEYVTEKFWRLKDLIVPVVLSRAVVNLVQIPNDTFIAASDFESPRDLAAYLDRLIDDKQEYAKYLEWTKKYRKNDDRTRTMSYEPNNAACKLCKLANEKRRGRPIANITAHWNPQECIPLYGVELLKRSERFKKAEARMAALIENIPFYPEL